MTAGIGLPPTVLPRAAALTALLLASDTADDGARLTDAEVEAVRRRLDAGLGRAGRGRRSAPVPWRVTGYAVRRAVADPDHLRRASPFRWSPTTARRPIGLAAVRVCVAGTARSPAEAVAATVASLAADGRHGLGRAGSLTEWAGRLSPPALAVAQAEATTWATHLWTAVEWRRLGPGVRLGGPAVRWSPSSSPEGSLNGRSDVRVTGPSGDVFLTLLPGAPGAGSREELGLAALAAALAGTTDGGAGAAARAVPVRVAGWWPDCGRALVVPVDHALLEGTAEAVLRAVAALASSPGGEAPDRGPTAGR